MDDKGRILHNRSWTPQPHHRLCSCHFTHPPVPGSRKIGWNHVLPDKLPGVKLCTPRSTLKSTSRTFCTSQLKRRKLADNNETAEQNEVTMPSLHHDESTDMDTETDEVHGTPEQALDTVHHDHDYLTTKRGGRVALMFDEMRSQCPEIEDFLVDYSEAKQCQKTLQKVQGQLLSLHSIRDNPGVFRYYTGLPSYGVFLALYNYLAPVSQQMQYVATSAHAHNAMRFHSKPGPPRRLSLEEEFFATLVRLRLGLPLKDLARRFGIAESTFCVIFNTWVILLAKELEQICCMPPVSNIAVKQAGCFHNFDNVRIVLDCTEVFSQTPSSLAAHQHMHSNYKHHSTVKFLVGMSPSGAVIYVSSMWGGRASDKKITSESDKLLMSLQPGDKVMVDRGFTIAKELPDGVTLIIPAFKSRNTGQFTKAQLEYSEKISVARIHVERAMRAIKECQILATEVKVAMISNYENIFKACAYLVNFKLPFLKV